MSYSDVVKEFEYKGFKCFIREINIALLKYCNGYIDITENKIPKKPNNYDFYFDYGFSQEVTFCDWVDDKFLIGFDTAHGYNTTETRTAKYVEEEIKKIVDRIIELEKGDKKI